MSLSKRKINFFKKELARIAHCSSSLLTASPNSPNLKPVSLKFCSPEGSSQPRTQTSAKAGNPNKQSYYRKILIIIIINKIFT